MELSKTFLTIIAIAGIAIPLGIFIGQQTPDYSKVNYNVDLGFVVFVDLPFNQTVSTSFNITNNYSFGVKSKVFLSSEPEWFADYVVCNFSLQDGDVLDSREVRLVHVDLTVSPECPGVGELYVQVKGVRIEET